MPRHIYTIEELMLDDSFINYCLSTGAAVPSEWRAIIRDNPEQAKTFEEAKKLVLALHGGLSRLEVNRQIEKVRQRLVEGNNEVAGQTATPVPTLSSALEVTDAGKIRKRSLRKLFSYGTVVCLLIATGWWFFFYQAHHEEGIASNATHAIHFQSLLGQRRTVSLPDGSVAILNSNSSVTIGAGYNKKRREVHLSGDAFFKVARDPQKPFIVYSGNISTTALGTEFYVDSKDAAESIAVELLEGKVRVENTSADKQGEGIILLPGEAGRLKGLNLVKHSFDAVYLRQWVSGEISFNETPFPEAIQQLRDWYDVDIKIKTGGLKSRIISGNYKNESLQNILKVMCFTINRRYSITDNTVIIE